MLDLLDLPPLIDKFKPVWMGLPRLTSAFIVFPLLSGTIVTGMLRNGLLLSLIIILFPMLDATYPTQPIAWNAWLWLIAKEVFIGVIIAFFISTPFWIVEGVGHIIDFQTGSSNSSVFDPIGGQESGITSQFLVQLTGVLFFISGGFLMVVSILFESYKIWPVYSATPHLTQVFESIFINHTGNLITMIIKLSAPIIMILVIVEFGLGLVGRFAPQLNVFWLSQPIKGLLATFILALFLTHLFDSLQGYLSPDRGILDILSDALE